MLLPPSATQQATQPLKRWLVGKDAFALAEPGTGKAIYDALAGERFPAVQAALGSAPTEVDVAGVWWPGPSYIQTLDASRVLSNHQLSDFSYV